MNREWIRRFSFFVDPQLKNADKELYRAIAHHLEREGIVWSEDLADLAEASAPRSYFLLSDSALEPDVGESDKVFVVGGANMSFFGKKEFAGS